MISLRVAWALAWLGAIAAFAFGYWKVDRERRSSFESRMRKWGEWQPWREKRIAEEFTA